MIFLISCGLLFDSICFFYVLLLMQQLKVLKMSRNQSNSKKQIPMFHVPGKFISLRKEETVLVNERVTTIIENNELRIAVVQIASRVVRRILPYVKIGQEVKIGERIGIIKFGSQVDLVIPKGPGIRIYVKPGDKVKAGVSIIAGYKTELGSSQ